MPAALRLEFRALLELYLIPGLAALMPWALGFRWLRFCSPALNAPNAGAAQSPVQEIARTGHVSSV